MTNFNLELMHSCCPGKTDIHAPEFKLIHTTPLVKGDLDEWECSGCKTVVLVFRKQIEDEPS